MSDVKNASKSKIVKTSSTAGSGSYKFSYASLSDMVKSGVEIPKMRIAVLDGKQYVEYFDGEEWQLGAQVITDFESRRMNKAQAYGSALTYARRYTVQMAMCVAVDDDKNVEVAGCVAVDDDKNVEVAGAVSRAQKPADNYMQKPATSKQIELLKALLKDSYDEVTKKNQPLTIGKASKLIAAVQAKRDGAPAKKKPAPTSEPVDVSDAEPITADDIPFN